MLTFPTKEGSGWGHPKPPEVALVRHLVLHFKRSHSSIHS